MKRPEVERNGDEFRLTWAEAGICMVFSQFRELSGETKAEIRVMSTTVGEIDGNHLHWGVQNLTSTRARSDLAKYLNSRWDQFEWASAIEQACTIVVREWRKGAPILELAKVDVPPSVPYLLKPLIPENETTILFGDGAAGKSMFALFVAAAVASGVSLPRGLAATHKSPVLYLDWESTDASEHARRLGRIASGLGLNDRPTIYYRQCQRPIHEEASQLAVEVARRNVGLIIVDSLAPACGGDPSDAQVATQTMNALRSLGATRLAVGHVNRTDRERVGINQTVFGSIFWRNMSRSMWQLVGSVDRHSNGPVPFALYNRKANNDALSTWPLGFQYIFGASGEPIRLEARDITGGDSLAEGATDKARIRAILSHGEKSTTDLATALGKSEQIIRATCAKMPEVFQIQNGGGRGRPTIWSLRTNEVVGTITRHSESMVVLA